MNNDIGLSLSALAKVLRRAKSGLHKLAKAGKIPRLANGRFDLAAVQRALEGNLEPSRARRSPSEQSGEQVNGRTTGAISGSADAEQAVSLIQQVLERENAYKGTIDFNAARTAETIVKTYSRWLDNEERSRRLVDADTMKDTVSVLAREDRDRWTNWPSQIGPLLAFEIGSDPVKTIIELEKHVRQNLADMAGEQMVRAAVEAKIEAL
ncbi:hypothetical protein N2603_23350 [Bradyrhizobium huanghuaihaiense]|uniref:hypothetical protein n=1 Tax=Bradyrhizobium huanghuaihaiense TaxID=990078 RepID=UPI0021AA4611|nr:hypothetical protein [Bradyrhizobium sp. CB3035]UWU73043.1 hypothetical protein N2603_23350 [Bradyrhizobium sp. CB3035]